MIYPRIFHFLDHLSVVFDEETEREFHEAKIYFTAPEVALESILEKGILPPSDAWKLIKNGLLNKGVLGYHENEDEIFNGCCPFWVSLELEISNSSYLYTPEALYVREKKPVVFKIKSEIKRHKTYPFFMPKFLFTPSIPYGLGCAIYRGKILPKFIESYGKLKCNLSEDLEAWSDLKSYEFHSFNEKIKAFKIILFIILD